MKDPREIFSSLIELRQRLGLEEGTYDFPNDPIVKQLEGDGIEVSFNEIEINPDGTLGYKGKRVVVFISDPLRSKDYLLNNKLVRPEGDKQPKFHLTMCQTLRSMDANRRYEGRYVSSRNKDSLFRVQARDENNKLDFLPNIRLFVCRNCIRKTNHQNYNSAYDAKKTEIVQNFDIGAYLEGNETPQDFNRLRHTETNVPLNDYTKYFKRICLQLKEKNNWHCSICNVDMSQMKGGLHCHHKNGNKADNRRNNLQILCALCHKNIDNYHSTMYVENNIEDFILRNRLRG